MSLSVVEGRVLVITVDYRLSFRKMIEAGQYAQVSEDFDRAENIDFDDEIAQKEGVVERLRLGLVRTDEEMVHGQVVRQIGKMNVGVPIDIYALLAIGAKYPNRHKSKYMYALSTRCEVDNDLDFAFLGRSEKEGRELGLWYYRSFRTDTYFPLVLLS